MRRFGLRFEAVGMHFLSRVLGAWLANLILEVVLILSFHNITSFPFAGYFERLTGFCSRSISEVEASLFCLSLYQLRSYSLAACYLRDCIALSFSELGD